MPDIDAAIEYLAPLPLYETEKPYLALLPPSKDFDPDTTRTDNLEYEVHDDMRITEIRDKNEFKLEVCGFQLLKHHTNCNAIENLEDIERCKEETQKLIKEETGAVHVHCYDVKARKNIKFERRQFDALDPLLIEGPAKAAHNDVTQGSGPAIIDRYLPEDAKAQFLKPGYRFRIMNTWRSLIDGLEDRPLTLCDARSVDPNDLVAADRILPDRAGEVYYLRHNPNHRWCWTEKQTPEEPYLFVLYDTKAGSHAHYCPHVSFANSRAGPDAAYRQSVETRSIVITEE